VNRVHLERKRMRHFGLLLFSPVLAAALAGCGLQQSAQGSFERTFTVQGPIRLELSGGSGDSTVKVGADGQVQVRGEIHVKDWSASGSRGEVHEFQTNPPVTQEGSVIRVGNSPGHWGKSSVDYTIEVPANTEMQGSAGSGDLSITGLQGAVTILSGSGDMALSQIGGDVRATSGSGNLTISNIAGQIQISTGSGDVTLAFPHSEVRIQTGTGDIQIARPADTVSVQTGNGNVEISDASADLRIHTASGDITVNGDARAGAFWELHANSGDITLNVPSSSSFELNARTGSGDITAQIPFVIEGTTGSHQLRARIGDGKAHVEAFSTSGNITLH
jgi:DUF4097 and DUF4098 domain-containing protein YvlB